MNRPSSNLRIIPVFACIVVIIAAVLTFLNVKQEAQRQQPDERKRAARYSEFATPDGITTQMRDSSKKFLRIDTPTESERSAAASLGTVIGDYSSFVVVAASGGKRLPRNVEVLRTSISLPGASFDPLSTAQTGTIAARQTESASPDGYYIVQFGTIANDKLLDSLRDVGVEILQYVPDQAFLVYASGDAIAKAAAHSRVRWVGGFLPEHKVSAELRQRIAVTKPTRLGRKTRMPVSPIETTAGNIATFNVSVFKREDLGEIASNIANITGGSIVSTSDLPNNYFNVVQVSIPIDQVDAIAAIPGVITLNVAGRRVPEDERSSQIIAGNYTGPTTIAGPGYNPLSQFGVDGTNVTVSVSDDGITVPGNGGFYLTAVNTVNGPAYNASAAAASGHGHLNASIIAGMTPFGPLDPFGYNYGLGVAPNANIVNIPFLNNTSTDAQAANDQVTVAGPNGVISSISNDSWGAGTNSNAYSDYEAEYDAYVRDASTAGTIDPLLFVFSAGNCGQAPSGSACSSQSGLTRPKIAKNIISVGSSESTRTTLGASGNINDIASYSSRGPAADGRIKPDIVAPGSAITGSRTTNSSGTFGPIPGATPDPYHVYSFGTSHAAPQISGVAALFTQFWKNGHAGTKPSPAMVKAAIINTGQEMTGTGATLPLPNGSEGWGRVNMKFMFNTGTTVSYFDQSTTLGTVGAVRNYSGTVTDNTKPVRVTLVWTDPPGVADPALVNNLNLSVTVGGNTYKGNVFSSGLSTTGGSADTVNNVENVWLPAGVTGPITASVTAAALNGDGILGDADTTDQNYALVFYNADLGPTAGAALDVSGKVVTSQGRGVTNAVVSITDNNGLVVTAVTGRNGIYHFTGIPAGKTYIVSVGSQRFTFTPKVVPLNDDNVTGLDFVAGQ
jgi:hypothetical protein